MLKKITLITLTASFGLFALGCNNNATQSSLPKNDAKGNPPFTKDAKPVADAEVAVIEMENATAYGKITIELYSNVAPKTVAQFKALIKEGVYNGTSFHRINQDVVQGGDPNTKDADPINDGQGKSDKPNIPAEFSDIPYDTGIVGAARSADINSGNSQFFMMLKRQPGFDKKYTIFGKVIEGMNNVRTMSGVQPKEGERPVEPVRIKTVTLQPHP